MTRWPIAFITLLLGALLLGHGAAAKVRTSPGSPAAQPPAQRPACGELGTIVTQPSVDPQRFCPEYLVEALPRSALAAITSIAYAPACEALQEPTAWCGALFFVRPDEGALMWIGPYDSGTRSYPLHTFASGLNTPNGLVWHAGSWYVAGDQAIYRLMDEDGDGRADWRELLVQNLPHGEGYWTGSIGVGPDGRLYVSQGAGCNACPESDPRRASILSYRLDGHNEQVFASGLRHAFDFAWHPASGDLWVGESSRNDLGEAVPLDELNRITGPGQHFGWPYCYTTPDGVVMDRTVPGADPILCQEATGPALTFTAHSSPAGMTFYYGAAFPELEGDLLLVAQGSWNRRIPSGYALYRICFDERGSLETCLDADGNPLEDEQGNPTSQERLIPVDPFYGYGLEVLQIQGQSFYPDHPVDVAVSPEGWIALSIMEGRVIQVRPSPGG